MHPTAGMRRGGGEIEPADRGLGPAQAGRRAEHELLVDLGGSPVERPADEIAVGGLQLGRVEDVPRPDPVAEPGGEALDLRLDPVGEGIGLALVPGPGQALPRGVAAHALGHVGVGPGHLLALRRPGRVDGGVLAEHEEGPVGHLADREGQRVAAELVQVAADVHGSGLPPPARPPTGSAHRASSPPSPCRCPTRSVAGRRADRPEGAPPPPARGTTPGPPRRRARRGRRRAHGRPPSGRRPRARDEPPPARPARRIRCGRRAPPGAARARR